MSKFIQPMTEYLENNLEELDERQGFIGSKLGYDKLKKAFSTDDIPENHTAKIRAKKQNSLEVHVGNHDYKYDSPIFRYLNCRIFDTRRSMAASHDYWNLHFALIKEVKESFDANNITVPYNQVDVHIVHE